VTLRGWAAGRQGTRLRCDCCKRIIVKPSLHVVPCTSCGHGHLREMVPRNWRCLCGEPQYDNLSKPPIRVECDKCAYENMERMRLSGRLDAKPDAFISHQEARRARRKA
jgi:hypothetical protein